MAVYFYTTRPYALYKAFKAAIAQTEAKGKIKTWLPSENDEDDFTHDSDDWRYEAWMVGTVDRGKRVRFNIWRQKGKPVSSEAYAYYHGHLIETFLRHFDGDFTSSEATALPTSDDACS